MWQLFWQFSLEKNRTIPQEEELYESSDYMYPSFECLQIKISSPSAALEVRAATLFNTESELIQYHGKALLSCVHLNHRGVFIYSMQLEWVNSGGPEWSNTGKRQAVIYRKIPIISPVLIFVQKAFTTSLYSDWPIVGGAHYWRKCCVSKWIGLAMAMKTARNSH